MKNLGTDCLDLLQLHCPPTAVYYNPDVFEALDRPVEVGKVRYYGASVKSPEKGLKVMDYPNVQSVQIIFNLFRQRPAELFLMFRSGPVGQHRGRKLVPLNHAAASSAS